MNIQLNLNKSDIEQAVEAWLQKCPQDKFHNALGQCMAKVNLSESTSRLGGPTTQSNFIFTICDQSRLEAPEEY
jgi:hypothetical protein